MMTIGWRCLFKGKEVVIEIKRKIRVGKMKQMYIGTIKDGDNVIEKTEGENQGDILLYLKNFIEGGNKT